MKKIILAVASVCIIFTGSAFADKSVRIVNDDLDVLTAQVQKCTTELPKSDPSKKQETKCVPIPTVNLYQRPMGTNYVDLTLPDDSEDQDYYYSTFIHVASAKTKFSSSTFTDPKSCEADWKGDVILLSSHGTDRVICTDRSIEGGASEARHFSLRSAA